MRNRVIGGEFELSSVPASVPISPDCFCYASGRAALYQILMAIKLTTLKVWLPDWLCESMIDAVKRAGINYGFYWLDQNLQMDVDRFIIINKPNLENEVIVLINYFGMVDVEQTITELRQAGIQSIIIEDDVQALFSFFDDKPHSADYRFTSLRKTIAAPDGGLVKTNHLLPKTTQVNTFADFKLKGALVKGMANETTKDDDYLALFEQGEELIEENYESGISEVARSILALTDFHTNAEKRRENARFLTNELSNIGIEPILRLTNDSVPLFVPIKVDNRDFIRRALRKNDIFCPVHWPLRVDMLDLFNGRVMAEKELSLVIDQRYSLEDMESIADVLKETICR